MAILPFRHTFERKGIHEQQGYHIAFENNKSFYKTGQLIVKKSQ